MSALVHGCLPLCTVHLSILAPLVLAPRQGSARLTTFFSAHVPHTEQKMNGTPLDQLRIMWCPWPGTSFGAHSGTLQHGFKSSG